MSVRGSLAALSATLLLGLGVPAFAQRSDPFYSALLDEGMRAFQRGEHLRASEDLRIAAFGLLESPAELARALTYLALAQNAAGDRLGFERTHARLSELENGFQAFSAAALSAETRGAFASAARAGIGEGALGTAASQTSAQPPATTAAVRPSVCISWGGADCRQVATGPESTEPPRPEAPSAADNEELNRLDGLATSKASNRELRIGFEEARALADRYPGWSEMQRVAGVLAARSGSFADAVDYYGRAGDTPEDGPLELFYLSVALFETDQPDAAATVLRRALPSLEQSREVRKYVRRILNDESAG